MDQKFYNPRLKNDHLEFDEELRIKMTIVDSFEYFKEIRLINSWKNNSLTCDFNNSHTCFYQRQVRYIAQANPKIQPGEG